MTVSSTNSTKSYTGDGSTTVFAYDFKIFDDDDIAVIIKTTSTGAETVKTKTTHYTVSGVGSASGGNITFTSGNVPTSAQTVVLRRGTALTQATDYTPNDPFPAATHEDALDKLTLIAQDQAEEASRTIKLSRGNTMTSTEFTETATNRANKILGFDGSGELTVTEGKVDTVTASVSAVSAGGTPTASATYTASSGALALAFGLVTGNTGATGSTGPRGSDAGLAMTFSNSTSDADPGAGKIAFNNATLSSVSILYIDDADDNSVDISAFIQSFDDVSNSVARGTILITKEGTPSTFAFFKVSGAVTDASGYTKVPVTHVVSNGTFSNLDGITLTFTYSGQDAGSTDLVNDTSPQLGGNLDLNSNNITGTGEIAITGGLTTTSSVGIGTASPADRLHVSKGSSGISSFSSNTAVLIEDDANAALQFATPNDANQQILFADPQSNTAGKIQYAHSTDAMTFDTGGTERMRVDSSGNVGIGTTSPEGNMHIFNSSSGTVTAPADANELVLESNANVGMSFLTANSSIARIKFGDPDATNAGVIAYNHSDDSLRFNASASERMRILSGGGITFNGDTAAANALDDYEEGTFTPTITTNSGNAATASAVSASYTKIGRLVHINVKINNIDTTGTTASSTFQIANLPFAHAGSDNFHLSCRFNFFTPQGSRTQVVALVTTSDLISFSGFGAGVTSTNVDHADLADDTADVFVTGTYETAT